MSIRKYKKKQEFQRQGKKCRTIGFILEGCFRSVKNNHGKITTFDLAIENEFITDYYSIISGKPSEMDIIAIEESMVACADGDKMLALFESGYNWQKIGRHLAEYVACYYHERLISSLYETPAKRYEQLFKTDPGLFLRIPHHILANYLGMTRETLSRQKKSNQKRQLSIR